MSAGLPILRSIIQSLETSSTATAAAVNRVASDYAWSPLVPPGHTSFSWTGSLGLPTFAPLVDPFVRESSNAPAASDSNASSAAAESAAPAQSSSDSDYSLFDKLDVRVGVVVEADKHPDAESLYLEKIDLGEAEPRQVISGLVQHVPLDQFVGSKVLVFANLKPSKLRGLDSFGMVFCACNSDRSKVELLRPPHDSKPGDRVFLVGRESSANNPDAEINPKKKNNVWAEVMPDMRTNSKGFATFKGLELSTRTGPILPSTLTDATVS
jgi:methionine--tRNA ligase beta chain